MTTQLTQDRTRQHKKSLNLIRAIQLKLLATQGDPSQSDYKKRAILHINDELTKLKIQMRKDDDDDAAADKLIMTPTSPPTTTTPKDEKLQINEGRLNFMHDLQLTLLSWAEESSIEQQEHLNEIDNELDKLIELMKEDKKQL